MRIKQQDRLRMERAHVRAWPALSTAVIDGWLWRCSGGGSQRANSVSTIAFDGRGMAAAIDAVEARYQAVGRPSRFHTYDDSAPAGLVEALGGRGYAEGEATMTMFKPLSPTMFRPLSRGVAAPEIECRERGWDEWYEVYLGAITASRRDVNRQILSAVPQPSGFVGYRSHGRLIATALCVVGFGCAVVECVATRADARRTGCGRAVTQGLLGWAAQQDADLVGLQVVPGNVPAVRLYGSLGFTAGATNRFWSREFA